MKNDSLVTAAVVAEAVVTEAVVAEAVVTEAVVAEASTLAPISNIKKPNLFSITQDDKPSNRKQTPKNQVLKGVIFALSGFVNPERTEIRDKGLKLGAKYRPDWTDECTHLM